MICSLVVQQFVAVIIRESINCDSESVDFINTFHFSSSVSSSVVLGKCQLSSWNIAGGLSRLLGIFNHNVSSRCGYLFELSTPFWQ